MDSMIFDYRIAIAVVERFAKSGKLSAESANVLRTKLTEKYNINSYSIFAA